MPKSPFDFLGEYPGPRFFIGRYADTARSRQHQPTEPVLSVAALIYARPGIPSKPYAEVSGSYGSFNTHKETVRAGFGTIRQSLGFWMRDSQNIQSDGYRDRATSDFKNHISSKEAIMVNLPQ